MNPPSIRICRLLSLVSFAALLCTLAVRANEPLKNSGKAAAKCASVAGVLLQQGPGKTWTPVKEGDTLASGARLVSMPRAEFTAASGAVKAKLLADIGKRGPFPVLEAGVILHDAADVDLDLTFERGLLVLENLKKEGEAKVRLRIRDETWVLHLQTPGAKVGLEIFGRHAPGLPKVIDEKTDDPTTDLLLLVLDGQAFLDTGMKGTGMHAPPGLARMHWNSLGRKQTFQRLEQLPGTIVAPLDDQETKHFKELSAATGKLARGDLGSGLDELLKSENKLERLVGVTAAGALDELPRVFGILMHSKDAATRDHAIVVLRHWLGREPGQVKRLHTALSDSKKLTEVQARNLLHLLFGFDEEERGRPDTYAVLLTYLASTNQAVRALAHWHLVRLAPAGKDIVFDASGPEEQRQQAVQRWLALIPDGRLPPRPQAQRPEKS